MMVIDLRATLYVHNFKPAFRICHSMHAANAMLHAYMLYHSTYNDIIKMHNAMDPAMKLLEI